MKIKNNRFLITGGAGFIGSHLVETLIKEGAEEIVIIDNLLRGTKENIFDSLSNKKVRFIKKNIINFSDILETTKEIDGVFHMASLCLAYCQEETKLAFDTNILGTYNVLEACVRNNVKRVIFSSSSSIYGDAVYSPMDENHPLGYKNFYGATKVNGEALFKAFYHKYNLPYLNLRYMNVYGPKQDYLGVYVAVIMKMIDSLIKNESPIIHGDGSQSFDFIYVDDVCRANIIAMETDISDESYNISFGKKISIAALCETIMKLMGSDIAIKYIKNNDNTLVTDRIGSVKKAFEELNFVAKVSLKDGLIKTINWRKKQFELNKQNLIISDE